MVERELTEKAKQDLKLIEKALSKGDPRAYNALMSKYRDPIFFMLYEKVSDKELAKELTIEAFGKAFKKARADKEYSFTFKDKKYTTRYKEETVAEHKKKFKK